MAGKRNLARTKDIRFPGNPALHAGVCGGDYRDPVEIFRPAIRVPREWRAGADLEQNVARLRKAAGEPRVPEAIRGSFHEYGRSVLEGFSGAKARRSISGATG